MVAQLIAPIEIKLTDAQLALTRDSIEYSVSVGDCEPVEGHTLRFGDYEGASAFQNRMFGMPMPTTREFISMQAVATKLDAAIVAWTDRRKRQKDGRL